MSYLRIIGLWSSLDASRPHFSAYPLVGSFGVMSRVLRPPPSHASRTHPVPWPAFEETHNRSACPTITLYVKKKVHVLPKRASTAGSCTPRRHQGTVDYLERAWLPFCSDSGCDSDSLPAFSYAQAAVGRVEPQSLALIGRAHVRWRAGVFSPSLKRRRREWRVCHHTDGGFSRSDAPHRNKCLNKYVL